MEPSELADVEAAIYDESFRTITEQSRVLDGLRTRAGTLVAVANVATAFLGGLAFSRPGATSGAETGTTLGVLEWAAIGLFCSSFAIALAILMPSRNWVFFHHPHALLSVYVEPGPPAGLSEFRRTIAYYNGVHYDANGRRLRVLGALLWAASVLLAADVVLWLIALAQ